MVSKKRSKELGAPDHFQVKAASALDWAILNKNQLLKALVTVVLIAVGAVGFKYWKAAQSDKLTEVLGNVQIQFDKEVKAAEDRIEELQKLIVDVKSLQEVKDPKAKNAKEGKKAKAKKPEKKTLTAEQKASNKKIEDQIAAVKPDHSKSSASFAAFSEANKSTPEGWMAGVQASNLLWDNGKKAEAKAILDRIVKESKNNPFYQVHTRFILIGILEDEQKYDEALKQVTALEKISDKGLKPKILLAKGRIQILKKASKDAVGTLTKLINDFSASAEAKKARSLRALIN